MTRSQVTWLRLAGTVVAQVVCLLLVPVLFCLGAYGLVVLSIAFGLSAEFIACLVLLYGFAFGWLSRRLL